MNGLRALLFRAGKLGVVFEDAGGSFLRTPPRNVGMRDDFLRWCVRVIQIIDASVQRHVIQRVRFQHFADRLLVIGGNLFPHHGRILPGDIDNADKDIGVIAVQKECLRKEFQLFQDEIQNVRTHLITPVIVDQMKIVDIRHQKGVLLFFASVIEKRKIFLLKNPWKCSQQAYCGGRREVRFSGAVFIPLVLVHFSSAICSRSMIR